MVTVIVHHRVASYAQWRPVYDSSRPMAQAAGELSEAIFRDSGDREVVTGIFGWDSVERAKAYFGSPDLAGKMAEAGVVGKPEIHFIEAAT